MSDLVRSRSRLPGGRVQAGRRRPFSRIALAAVVGLFLASATEVAAQQGNALLSVGPAELVFAGTDGQGCSGVRTVTIVSTNGEQANWQVASSAPWLLVNSASGQTPSQITASVNCTGLSAGVHQATLTVSATNAANGPFVIPVTIVVNPQIPVSVATWKDGRRGAFSASTDDGYSAGFTELVANGLRGTFVMNGEVAPPDYAGMFAAGMELGSHLVSHFCFPVDETTLRFEIEANVAGVTGVTGPPDPVTMVWPCGVTTPEAQLIAAEYFLSARGYNINELEDPSPANLMNLKSFNSHEHVPFPPSDLRTIADAAEAEGKWANLVLHGFTNDDGAIAYAKTRDLWVAPIGDVVKYILQRDRTIVDNFNQSASSLSFTFKRLPIPASVRRSFESALKNSDVVTFRVALPSTHYVSNVLVGGSAAAFDVRQEQDGRYLYFSAQVTQNSQLAAVSLTTDLPSILAVSSQGFDVTVTSGETVPTQTFSITNAGEGPLAWSASVTGEGPSWLSVSPASGNGPAVVSVVADASGLAPGTYQRTVVITSPDAVNGPVSVPYTLRVLPEGMEQLTLNYPDRTGLLAAGWDFLARTAAGTVRNTEQTTGATVAYSGTDLRVPVDQGDLWAEQNDTRNTLFRNLPSDWSSVRVQLDFWPFQDVQQAGIAIYQDDDNFVQVLRQFSNEPVIVFEHETGGVPTHVSGHTAANTGTWFLRLDRDTVAGTITGLYSIDGITWQQLGTIPLTLTNHRLALLTGGSPGGLPTASFRFVQIVRAANAETSLVVSPAALSFVAIEGATPPQPQTLQVSSTGSGTLAWTASVGGTGWLAVTPASGSGAAALSVTVTPTGLTPGTYTGAVTVTATGAANSPQTVPVTLTVLPAGSEYYAFTYPDRASLLAVGWDFLARTAAGAVRDTEQTSGAVVAYNQAGALVIPADLGDLWEGLNDTRNSLFRNLPATWSSVRVRLDFAPTQNYQQAGLVVYDHDDHYVHITRMFNGSQRMVFARETGGIASVVSNVSETATTNLWLRLDRDLGTGSVSAAYSVNGGTTWQALGSAAQTFAQPRLGIIVGASFGGFPPAVVHEVHVETAVGAASPVLAVSPAALSFVAVDGEAPPSAQTLQVTNAGDGTLTWTASVGGTSWLAVTPASGSGAAALSVTVTPTGLTPGTYTGAVTVTATGAANSPQTVPVTLTVLPAGSEYYAFTYPDRASLLAVGWDFLARTAAGAVRDTEQTSGAVVAYNQAGALVIPADVGDLWEGLNDTRNSVFRDLPADWTSVRAYLSFAPTQNYQQAGLVVYANDDTYVHITRMFNGGQRMVFASESGGVATVPGVASVSQTDDLILRIDRDPVSGVITGSYSLDGGASWQDLGSVTATLPNPRVGLIVGASPGGFPPASFRAVQVMRAGAQ